MASGFLFWNKLASQNLNLDTIQQTLQPASSQHRFIHKNFGKTCGLAYISPEQTEQDWEENDRAIAYSPNGLINYKQHSGKKALRILLEDYRHDNKFSHSDMCNGFSLIVLDKSTGEVTAAIDKFGINRLYYTMLGDAALISDSLSTLVAALPERPKLSDQAIYNFIDSHVIPSPLTIYQDIFKIEPAQVVRFTSHGFEKQTYWIPDFNESQPDNLSDLQEKTRSALSNAVNRCGISDTTGAFLSGGLDSSTVAGFMARNNPDRTVATYTMGFAEAGYDETEYAEMAARHFGTNLRHYYVTPDDVADAFSFVISRYDEPFGNSSAIPAYLCARFAHNDGITSMLAGDGGDELFAGNERYAKQHVFEQYQHIPAIFRNALLQPLLLNSLPYTRVQPFSKAKSYIQQALTPMPDRMERYNFINHFGAETIFNPNFLSSVDRTFPIQGKRAAYHRPQDATMLNRMLYMDWKFTLADNDLVKVTTACELAGVNVCYPMLDDELVQLSAQIPSMLKMKNGRELRSFYKNTVRDFLPEPIIHKSKHGFGLPFGEWLKKSPTLQDKIYDNLNQLKGRNYVSPTFIDNIIDMHRTDNAASFYGTMVWILAVLEEWLQSRKL